MSNPSTVCHAPLSFCAQEYETLRVEAGVKEHGLDGLSPHPVHKTQTPPGGRQEGRTHLPVVPLGGQLVQLQQGLVDGLLELQGGLHGLQARAPLVLGGLGDGLQHHPAPALVLVRHQLLGVLGLLVRALLEELVEPGQGHIVTVKVAGLKEPRGA